MYIRRKVFSSFIDEYGEERYFSTTEFEDERLYADVVADMQIEEAKRRIMEGTATDADRKLIQSGGLHEQRVRNEIDAARDKNGAVVGGKEEKKIINREKRRKKADPNYGKVTPLTTTQKSAGWLKKTYGKGAQHRGRNIAITAAVPVIAGGTVAATKIAKKRKAKRVED